MWKHDRQHPLAIRGPRLRPRLDPETSSAVGGCQAAASRGALLHSVLTELLGWDGSARPDSHPCLSVLCDLGEL